MKQAANSPCRRPEPHGSVKNVTQFMGFLDMSGVKDFGEFGPRGRAPSDFGS